MEPVAKGMIQVAGATDHIVRTTHGRLMRELIRTAIPSAKTSWVGRLALG